MASLVLATDAEGELTSRALIAATKWLVLMLLISVIVIVVALASSQTTTDAVVPVITLVLMTLAILFVLTRERVRSALAGVLVMGLVAFVFALAVEPLLTPGQASDSIVLTFPVIAATMVGVGQRSLLACLVVCGIGSLVAEAAAVLGVVRGGRNIVFDVPVFASFLAVSLLLAVIWTARRSAVKGSQQFNQASRTEQDIIEEARVLSHVSSVLHDTVLNDLHLLAMLPTGGLSDAHVHMIRRDLEMLSRTHEVLLAPDPAEVSILLHQPARNTLLGEVLERASARGLRVIVSGSPSLVGTLSAPAEEAIVAAIDQCLVNVSKHAEVESAELAITAASGEITVMVTDAGHGFVVAETASDRLGLRLSVHERIRAIGGSVTVWSTPGAGTSVLLAIPLDAGRLR